MEQANFEIKEQWPDSPALKHELPRQKAENKAMRVELEQRDPIRCKRVDTLRHCVWEDDEDSWDTHCGNKHQFTTDGPRENNHKYCPYCGLLIHIHVPEPENFQVWEHNTGERAYWYVTHFVYLNGDTCTPFGDMENWKFTGDVVNLDVLKGASDE